MEVIKKEKEEETFGDMRRSIQMMTHTSIILAGGIQRKCTEEAPPSPANDQNNNKDKLLQNSPIFPKRKTFRERIQNKLAFTIQRPYAGIGDQVQSFLDAPNVDCDNDFECLNTTTNTQTNGLLPMRNLPDINIESPTPTAVQLVECGSLESRPSSAMGFLIKGFNMADNSTVTAEKGERVWFIETNDSGKESKL